MSAVTPSHHERGVLQHHGPRSPRRAGQELQSRGRVSAADLPSGTPSRTSVRSCCATLRPANEWMTAPPRRRCWPMPCSRRAAQRHRRRERDRDHERYGPRLRSRRPGTAAHLALRERQVRHCPHRHRVGPQQNAEIGALVADAVEQVGSEGVVEVDEARGPETTLEVVEGMQLLNGEGEALATRVVNKVRGSLAATAAGLPASAIDAGQYSMTSPC